MTVTLHLQNCRIQLPLLHHQAQPRTSLTCVGFIIQPVLHGTPDSGRRLARHRTRQKMLWSSPLSPHLSTATTPRHFPSLLPPHHVLPAPARRHPTFPSSLPVTVTARRVRSCARDELWTLVQIQQFAVAEPPETETCHTSQTSISHKEKKLRR